MSSSLILLKENDTVTIRVGEDNSSTPTHILLNKLLLPLIFSPQNNMLTFADHIGMRLSDDHMSYGHANLNSTTMVTMGDESGASTPPLWSPTHQPQNIDYRCLSPSSKAEAIARGQRELMELVSRMPEACYELSLRDLVEHHHQPLAVETKQEINKKNNKKKKNPKGPQIKRSGSMDNGGFLLKMVFPISLGSKKKKKTKSDTTCQKATVSDSCGGKSTVDKEWWKKRSGSSESTESGGSTLNTGSTKSIRSSSTSSSSCSSRNSSRRHKRGGCLAFILRRKAKSSR